MCYADWYDVTGLNFGQINIFVFVIKDLSNIFFFSLKKERDNPSTEAYL